MTTSLRKDQLSVRPVGSQAIILAAATGFAQILMAVIYILSARSAPPAEFGAIVMAIAVGNAAVGFLDFGTNSLWVRELSRNKITIAELSARVSTKFAFAALIASTWIIVMVAFKSSLAIAGAIFFVGVAGQTLLVPLRAQGLGDKVARLLLLERAIALLCFLVLWATGIQTLWALWMSIGIGTASMGMVAHIFQPRATRFYLSRRTLPNPWTGARHYGIGSLASSAQQLDLPLLRAVAGATAAGVYGSVNRWTQPMGLLSSAFSQAAAPFIAGSVDWKSARQLVTKAAWILGMGISACVAIIAIAPWAVRFLLGADYAGSALVLQWLAAGTAIVILNQPLASFLQSRTHDDLVAYVFLGSVALQLSLVALLGWLRGAEGAAIAYCVLQVVLFASLVLCLRIASRREREGQNR